MPTKAQTNKERPWAHRRPGRVRRRWEAAAFTLVEVMVSVAIVGITFFSLYSGITYGFTVLQLARENLRATQIMAEKMEVIRLVSWDQINSNGFIPSTFTARFYTLASGVGSGATYTGAVDIAAVPLAETYSPDLRQVTITVKWLSSKKVRTRAMTTFVSRYGLQNYIY